MRIIDMHCDTISKIQARRMKGRETDINDPTLMANLPALKKGGYALQNFALYVDKGEHPFRQVKELLDVFRQEMAANQDRIRQVTDTGQLLENERDGRLSALLTVEEGGVCEGELSKLKFLYEQGVRMMTLTWNYPNELGYPNFSPNRNCYTPDTEHGLTGTGFAFVQEMEQMGMIVDVSHLSDAGFYDVAKVAKKPFVASHSNARAVCPWVRNLTDDMIRTLADRGGVIGLNFCGDFLRDDTVGQKAAGLADVVRHARHMVNVGGIECVGLGSDFDGIPPYTGMPRAECMEELAEVFRQGEFSENEIDRIFYGNVFRVYKMILG